MNPNGDVFTNYTQARLCYYTQYKTYTKKIETEKRMKGKYAQSISELSDKLQ